jgi:hypothetical protein
MSTEGKVTRERRGHVLLIGLDRAAKRNAFDLAMWDDLCRAYGELERDHELRCGVLFAHGDHFTGGLDLPSWVPVFSSGTWAIPDDGIDPLGLTGPRISKPIGRAPNSFSSVALRQSNLGRAFRYNSGHHACQRATGFPLQSLTRVT